MSLKRIALITGANRGIGFEVSRQLGRLGYTLVLGCRSEARGRTAREALRAEGIDATPVGLDMADPASIEAAAAQVGQDYPHLDVLVNNAAIHYDTWQRASNADLAVVQEAITTNTLGPWRLSMALLPMLLRSKAPRIVNVSSGGGSIASMSGKTPAYSVSKAGLNAVTRMLARDLEGDGILVNAVCPGWTQTEMGEWGGRPVADGAAGVVWAATLDSSGPSGGFFQDMQPVPW